MALQPVTLEGQTVRLEPLDLSQHRAGLQRIGLEPSLWRYTSVQIRETSELEAYLDQAATELAEHRAMPFAIIHRASGAVAGCTRFGNIEPAHKRLEIGWTWVGRLYQRSAVNTETKYLLFRHVFETLGWNRVELKTSALNEPSKSAMRRLGLMEEGVLRQHMINQDGTLRDSVYFSVIREEWPVMKARLEGFMAR